jgi:hypothetical protein
MIGFFMGTHLQRAAWAHEDRPVVAGLHDLIEARACGMSSIAYRVTPSRRGVAIQGRARDVMHDAGTRTGLAQAHSTRLPRYPEITTGEIMFGVA